PKIDGGCSFAVRHGINQPRDFLNAQCIRQVLSGSRGRYLSGNINIDRTLKKRKFEQPTSNNQSPACRSLRERLLPFKTPPQISNISFKVLRLDLSQRRNSSRA